MTLSGRRPVLLALDPSFTATGWVAVDLSTETVIDAGLIRTAPPKKTERLTAAEANADRGIHIRREVSAVLAKHRPVIVVQEGNAGSKSAKAAAGLARAQQACVDACDVELGARPVLVTPQAVKKHACSSLSASKDDLKLAALGRWGPALGVHVAATKAPEGKHENIYDAACVASLAWLRPDVAALRTMAQREGWEAA